MAPVLLATALEAALAHAETAVRRAGRVPAAREALGLVAYRLPGRGRALGGGPPGARPPGAETGHARGGRSALCVASPAPTTSSGSWWTASALWGATTRRSSWLSA